MIRAALILITGLVGAAIVHIVVVLTMPSILGSRALASLGYPDELYQFVPLGGGSSAAGGGHSDPFIETIACRYNIENGPIHVTAADSPTYWSAALLNSGGQIVASYNDRAVIGSAPDILVATGIQAGELRKSRPSDLTDTLFSVVDDPAGYVLLRVYRPNDAISPQVEAFLQSAECDLY